jgi:ABC-type branched-subunit amino acid transport system substrate-binding protein
MKAKIILGVSVIVVLCAALMIPASAVRAAEDTIKIGVIGPFTGPVAFNGGEMKKGMMLAVDEANAKGGVFGRKIEVAFGDTESKPDKGVAVVKKLITRDKVLVVGGGYHSSVNIAT